MPCPSGYYIEEITWDEFINCPRRQFTLGNWGRHLHVHSPYWTKCSKQGVATLEMTTSNFIVKLLFFKAVPVENRPACSPYKIVVFPCSALPKGLKCHRCTLPLGLFDGRLRFETSYQRPANRTVWEPQLCMRGTRKQSYEVDLLRPTRLTGISTWLSPLSRDTGSVVLKYKTKRHQRWRIYEQIFGIADFEGMKFYWLLHLVGGPIEARYVEFQVMPDSLVVEPHEEWCFSFELYGCDHDLVKWKNYVYPSEQPEKLAKVQHKHDKKAHGANSKETKTGELEEGEHILKEYKESPRDTSIATLVACYTSAGLIALIGMYIVYKWEYHERRIRPEYLK